MPTRTVKLFFTSMMETPPPEATLKAPSDHKYKKFLWQCYFLQYQVGYWIILYITNSLLFEREARSPDDRPITKNPDHALGASCCECFQESQRTESTKEKDNDLKQGIFKDDFHQNAQFTSFTCKLYNGCKCKGSLVVATDHCWGTIKFKDLQRLYIFQFFDGKISSLSHCVSHEPFCISTRLTPIYFCSLISMLYAHVDTFQVGLD